MMKEFLLDWEKDTVEGAIEGLVGMGLVRDAKEFLNLLGGGRSPWKGSCWQRTTWAACCTRGT